MLLNEILLRRLMKTKLFEMAFHRKTVIEKIDNISMPLAEHMVKVLYFDYQYQARTHWFREINGYLSVVFRANVKNANPPRLPYETYFHLLWEGPFGEGPIEVEWHLKRMYVDDPEYKNIPKSGMSIQQIYRILQYFYHDICTDFAKDEYKGLNVYTSRYGMLD